MYKRSGHYENRSRFICLRCEKENLLAVGIHRKQQKERLHVKNLFCLNCNCYTYNVEVRSCDMYKDIEKEVGVLKRKYYAEYSLLGNLEKYQLVQEVC